jgi:hypothetical protein
MMSTQKLLANIQTVGNGWSIKPKYQLSVAKKINKPAKQIAPVVRMPFNLAHSQAPAAINKSAKAQKGHGFEKNSVGNTIANIMKAVMTRCLSIVRL